MKYSFKDVNSKQQQGAALGVGLILLLAMSISGIYILNSSVMDERMSANHRNQVNAFLAAEAGLMRAQRQYNDVGWPPNNCSSSELHTIYTNETYGNSVNFSVIGYDCDPAQGITLRSEGVLEDFGVTRVLTARYTPPGPEGGLPGDAPAAISCLGGGCVVKPGQGRSSIDGRDYTLPPWASNVNEYRRSSDRLTGNTMPSIFLTDRGSSSVGSGGGQFEFCGAERTNCNASNTISDFYSEDNFPVENGQPTHPTADQFFDPGTPLGDLVSTSSEWGTRDSPNVTQISSDQSINGGLSGSGVMIIDGANLDIGGNVRFEGLIVIRGCGTINLSGTPMIYGAIMVDARDCEQPYEPFGQSGTPTVAFSMEALGRAGELIPSGAGGLQNWSEEIQGL